GSGPPPEEARRFLALAAGEAPAVAGIAGTEDLAVDWLGVRPSEGAGSDERDEGNDASYDGEPDEMPEEGEGNEESESGDGGE
ncbi:MAG: hypothetical protein QG573_1191, partial [Acidobacteriota bacterium]|nr:hypothetical protein [Acidobacteriota bacterium]